MKLLEAKDTVVELERLLNDRIGALSTCPLADAPDNLSACNTITERLNKLQLAIEQEEDVLTIEGNSYKHIVWTIKVLDKKIALLETLKGRGDLSPQQYEEVFKQLENFCSTRDILRTSVEESLRKTELILDE